MAVPNSFTPGTSIESGTVNANFTDIASEITNSLPRDGQAGMSGPLKAASGSASAPGLAFSADTDTGFFRKASNVIGVAVGGAEVGTIDDTGFSSFPSATKMLFVQTAAPTGWTKDTTHNNKALRVVSGTASSGGSTNFTDVFKARTIAKANLPASTLSVTGTAASNGAHSHSYTGPSNTEVGSDGNGAQAYTQTRTTSTDGAHTHSVSGTTEAMGSGTALDFAVAYVDTVIATKD